MEENKYDYYIAEAAKAYVQARIKFNAHQTYLDKINLDKAFIKLCEVIRAEKEGANPNA